MWYFGKKPKYVRRTLGNLLTHVFLPGVLILYFIYTEQEFKEEFIAQFQVMLFFEYVFLYTHLFLVYMFLPLSWVLSLLSFARILPSFMEIHRAFFGTLVHISTGTIVFLTLTKLLSEVFLG